MAAPQTRPMPDDLDREFSRLRAADALQALQQLLQANPAKTLPEVSPGKLGALVELIARELAIGLQG